MSGSTGAGACADSTTPAQREHSLGGSEARRARTGICRRMVASAILFIVTCEQLLEEPKLPGAGSKGLMFFNSSWGGRLPASELSALKEAVLEAGLEVHDVTPELDIGAAIDERLRQGRCLVVAAGGDGTIHHVLQSLVNNPDATLAVLPIGTYNHFAKDLSIPLDWRAALEIALTGETRVVDAARVNDRYFVNNVSMGLYPELVVRPPQRGGSAADGPDRRAPLRLLASSPAAPGVGPARSALPYGPRPQHARLPLVPNLRHEGAVAPSPPECRRRRRGIQVRDPAGDHDRATGAASEDAKKWLVVSCWGLEKRKRVLFL